MRHGLHPALETWGFEKVIAWYMGLLNYFQKNYGHETHFRIPF